MPHMPVSTSTSTPRRSTSLPTRRRIWPSAASWPTGPPRYGGGSSRWTRARSRPTRSRSAATCCCPSAPTRTRSRASRSSPTTSAARTRRRSRRSTRSSSSTCARAGCPSRRRSAWSSRASWPSWSSASRRAPCARCSRARGGGGSPPCSTEFRHDLAVSLELPPEDMRRLGYRVIDALVEHWSSLDVAPTVAIGDADALRESLGGPPPDAPGDPDLALERLLGDVVPWTSRNIHPRWFARISSPSNYVSALADAVASGFNLLGTSWVASSGPSTVELTVLDWLREWCGMPSGTEGLLTSGGSIASLTALVAAREARGGGGVVYMSDQAHASILRDLRVMGEGEVRVLRSDSAFRLPVAAVADAVAADRAAGFTPFAVVGNAGTTNTGAVDPLVELAELCAVEGLWFHVDGAYGAAAVLTDSGRGVL